MQPDLSHIKSTPLFKGLADNDIARLIENGRLQNYKNGESIYHHGDKVQKFYVIISGDIQLFRETPDGQEKTLDILKSGQTMSESEIMDSCHGHRITAKALSNVTTVEFPAAWLKKSAQEVPAFALNLLSLIAAQMHAAEVEAEHQASMSAPQLVACFLQRICILHDFNPQGFELPYSKTVIASRLGMELETFSRTLAKLKNHGIVVDGNKVAITDLAKIEAYVCDFCSISGDCKTHRLMEGKF